MNCLEFNSLNYFTATISMVTQRSQERQTYCELGDFPLCELFLSIDEAYYIH